MTEDEKLFWDTNGYLVVNNAVSDEQIDTYIEFWNSHHVKDDGSVSYYGWDYFTCYMDYPEILDILCSEIPFSYVNQLVSNRCGIHLAFTYFKSRERGWHRDELSQDSDRASKYIAMSIALEDVHPDSGTLCIIPGSHLWEVDHGEAYETKGYDPFGALHFSSEIEKRNPEPVAIIQGKGSVTFWHGHTVHKVNQAKDASLGRKVVIGHLIANENGSDQPSDSLVDYKFGRFHRLEEDKEKTKETNFKIFG